MIADIHISTARAPPPLSRAMIKAAFRCDGEVWPCAVDRAWSLSDVQRMLCEHFHARFPAMNAVLKYGDVLYDEFSEKPFQNLSLIHI